MFEWILKLFFKPEPKTEYIVRIITELETSTELSKLSRQKDFEEYSTVYIATSDDIMANGVVQALVCKEYTEEEASFKKLSGELVEPVNQETFRILTTIDPKNPYAPVKIAKLQLEMLTAIMTR